VGHIALFEKFHGLEGDGRLSDTDRPGNEKNWQRHRADYPSRGASVLE
jgi:hypothetical protein